MASHPARSLIRILHKSQHFLVIDKPFDVVLNSDDPQRESVCNLLKEQHPDTSNDKLKVCTFFYVRSRCKCWNQFNSLDIIPLIDWIIQLPEYLSFP